jgi:DNA-binding transcriptional regulator YiaG
MSKPRKVHTTESLLARTLEDGDCRVWQGYSTNKTPQVDHQGRMTSVRKLLFVLSGKVAEEGAYFGAKCQTVNCVCPDHIIKRHPKLQMKAMAKAASTGTVKAERLRKMTQTRRKTWAKLDMEKANTIRNSEESGPVLAQRYGITRSLVNRIKRGDQWRDTSNPFAGLMA